MKKATHKTPRAAIQSFEEIINVGPATAEDFRVLGFNKPIELAGRDPLKLYHDLCHVSGQRQDPCVLDVLIATVDYMNGGTPKAWWKYTAQRKRKYGAAMTQ
jgi:Pathogenicity locus